MGNISVKSTNSQTGGKSVVRIYKGNELIAEEFVPKRSPLKYLKTMKRSKHLKSLERQLIKHGLLLEDVGIVYERR